MAHSTISRRIHYLGSLWACLTLLLVRALPTFARADLYVATNGDNANPGTLARPLATLEAARDAIRSLKAKGPLPPGGVTVWIRGGTYVRDGSFELTSRDSGAPEAPIVYRAAANESVRLLGGRVLQKFEHVTETDGNFSRLNATARRHIWRSDLRALGLRDFGPLVSRGFGRPISPSHPELFCNGQPMTLARWPNEGEWERIAGFPADRGQADEHGGKIGALQGGFNYAGDRPKRWQDVSNVWVHGYWSWDWANSYERVESLDLENHLIKTAPPHGLYGFRKGQRFYFLNVLEELDQPGEWFLDRPTGQLYFWPPEGQTDPGGRSAAMRDPANGDSTASLSAPPSGEVLISLLGAPLISLQDVSEVTLRGLRLEATRGHGIRIHGGTNDLVAGCAVRLIGNYGVWIEGGHHHGVVSCDIENTGDGGVSLSGGDRQTLAAGGHFVENCHFQKQGRWSKCYVPAVLVSGVGNRVAHNLIHDHPHCAILFGGNDHQIEFNEIHHVALETGDVGAIYTGRDWTFRGNAIRYNFIHHTGGVGMGSMGVYMDDCVSGTEIFGNIFYKVTRAAFLGGGRDHHVENNIFVDCDPAVQLDGRGLDKSPVWHSMVYGYMKKQFDAVPPALYRARYPALTSIAQSYEATTNGIPPAGNIVARNICVGGKWLSVGWHAAESMLDLHDNYVGPDPGFVAPGKMDFRLGKDSPCWRIGFQQIPTEKIGLQEDEYRRGGIVEALK